MEKVYSEKDHWEKDDYASQETRRFVAHLQVEAHSPRMYRASNTYVGWASFKVRSWRTHFVYKHQNYDDVGSTSVEKLVTNDAYIF